MTDTAALTTRQRHRLEDDAHHEAGHAVAYLAAGFRVTSIWVLVYEPGYRARRGDLGGRTQRDASDYIRSGGDRAALHRADRIAALAAEAADTRRGVAYRRSAHILEVAESIGGDLDGLPLEPTVQAALDALLAEAEALVERHWLAIERLAAELVARPDHALYDLDPSYLAESVTR